MTHRIRMARKRLMVARERALHAASVADDVQWTSSTHRQRHIAYGREIRRKITLRAIERRKDQTC